MNFEELILDSSIYRFEHVLLISEIHRGNWTKAMHLIKLYSEIFGIEGNLWFKGYVLLENVFNDRDQRLAITLVQFICVCNFLSKNHNEFPLLEGIFHVALKMKEIGLLSKLFAAGLSVNSSFDVRNLLCDAIYLNAGLDIISMIIDEGACVNLAGPDMMTPLATMIRTALNDLDLAELLLSSGANVNLTCLGPLAKSPVHLACEVGNLDGLKWLLNQNADVNAQSADGDTCLHIAVRQHNLICIRILLEHNASLNIFNNKKQTPLYIAVSNNDIESSDLLLQKRASVDCYLNKALRFAVIMGNGLANVHKVCIFDLLKKYGFVFTFNLNDLKFIHAAALHGHFCIITKFLKLGGSPDSTYQNTPLLFNAIRGANKNTVEILLKYGCDLTVTDKKCEKALSISISSNLSAITKLLLNWKCEINDGSQFCYICIAAERLNIETIQNLLKFGAFINTVDSKGFSPLHYAIISNFNSDQSLKVIDLEKAKVVKFLLQNGADLMPKFETYVTPPMNFAISLNYTQVVMVLLENGASTNIPITHGGLILKSTILHFAINYYLNEMIELLLQKGVPVNVKQYDGKKPLQLAVEINSWEIVRTLLKNGAKAKSKTTYRHHMISYAVDLEYSLVVAELLKFGADIETMDSSGSTPLQKACQRKNAVLVATLLKYGADINVVNNDGCTPFMLLDKSTLAETIVAQGNWFAYVNGDNIAGPSSVLYHLQGHAFKLALVGLPLHPCYNELVLNLRYAAGFVNCCMQELDIIKNTTIASYLSPYNIIKKKHDPVFVHNKDFVLNMKDDDKLKQFTLFSGILRYSLNKAKLRCSLLDSAENWLSGLVITSGLPFLPREVIRQILCFLSSHELEFLLQKEQGFVILC